MVTTQNLVLLAVVAFIALISGINFKVSEGDSLNRYYIWKLFGFGVMLHRIHGSDPEGIYHNHPWPFVSLIFGRYVEWVADVQWDDGRIVGITHTGHSRRFINFGGKRHHRVEIPYGPVWTVILHGPRNNRWSTINKDGGIAYEPWKGAGKGRSYAKALDAVPDLHVGETLISKSKAASHMANLEYLNYVGGDSTQPERGFNPNLPQSVLVTVDERQAALERASRWTDRPDVPHDYDLTNHGVHHGNEDITPDGTGLQRAIERGRGGPPPTQLNGFA
jgi:hypothetical protein